MVQTLAVEFKLGKDSILDCRSGRSKAPITDEHIDAIYYVFVLFFFFFVCVWGGAGLMTDVLCPADS